MFDFAEFDKGAQKVIEHAQGEIGSLRSGGANISLLDPVNVDAYGAKMKIAELASITIADPTLIVVTPWDKSLLAEIAKGIQQANINLNPVVDSDLIRISVPALTEEARKEQVKILSQRLEAVKVMVRGLRADIKKDIEAQDGQPGISDDDIKADLENLEEKTKSLIKKLDELAQQKEKQLLTL
ncbi:MAG: ribosome recycling factor [Pseudomonadales bacterium]|jgi:ribosome recycling factor|nr:ribosome recycling factor [Pseudomonadales bacterium]